MDELQTYHINGLDCPDCAKTLELGIANMQGVKSCAVNFSTESLRIEGDVTHDDLAQRVAELGYQLEDSSPTGTESSLIKKPNFLQFFWGHPESRLAVIGAILILPGMVLEEWLGMQAAWIDLASLAAMLLAGYPVFRGAFNTLRLSRRINIDVLMTLAAVGAVIIGAFTEGGMVMVLYAVGEALEGFAVDRSRDSLRSLMNLAPKTAVRLQRSDGVQSQVVVPVEELTIGDVVLVKPGERIPMDGMVSAGSSNVNQAPVTGESALIEKMPGDDVFASSINGEGALEIRVTHLAKDNTISRLIRMVEEAQEKRAPSQRFVDRFAAVYTPSIMAFALAVAVIPPLFFGQPFWNPTPDEFGWLYRGLALLVVGCPCALVISTPVSIISAISSAARNGVLIKGGAALETLSRVKAVALDKTGTLTEGKPSVVQVRALAWDEAPAPHSDRLVALASAVEQRSSHPLARAILHESAQRGVQNHFEAAKNITTLVGRGVSGVVNGKEVLVGSHKYFDENIPHDPQHCQAARQDSANGCTAMMISDGGRYVGTITVSDTLRNTSRETIDLIRKSGVDAVALLTGDHAAAGEQVGSQVGVDEVKAELLPEDKVAAVHELKSRYGLVAMVGDGINDAPALAAADVGIAIGAALGGTAQAMETADIALMGEDIRQIPYALRLSHDTMKIIKQNVTFTLGIKLMFVLLVLVGWGTMWMAVFADTGAALIVILNGMRLLRNKPLVSTAKIA